MVCEPEYECVTRESKVDAASLQSSQITKFAALKCWLLNTFNLSLYYAFFSRGLCILTPVSEIAQLTIYAFHLNLFWRMLRMDKCKVYKFDKFWHDHIRRQRRYWYERLTPGKGIPKLRKRTEYNIIRYHHISSISG